jgi:tRNA-binding EMAP/Myf-like protein
MVGKHILIITNLKPAKLGGELSQGMLLAAISPDEEEVILVETDASAGSIVTAGNKQNNTKEITFKDFMKIKTKTEKKRVCMDGEELRIDGKPVTIDVPDGYTVS